MNNKHEDEFCANEFYADVAAGLDELEAVPTGVLSDVVTRDGACMWLTTGPEHPEWDGDEMTDRSVAARICADCGVRDECLELEFRTAGFATFGVWGALAEDDRRAAYLAWSQRRDGGRE
ncbi:MAG TPA: WhiB family transcriptional regulator [Amycolatopsis sp.]|uniref:WhiB family transcriptional regulator n=1 Tax=Amycolatopsis sp. TaxID=37632 RepID=UPI002B46D4CD|nr:WhiB family transcriptional regulator [Amycolatopsis sp.]HKS45137.1 WhiB family transcriptional regulator [Amycolatopsis sp.]